MQPDFTREFGCFLFLSCIKLHLMFCDYMSCILHSPCASLRTGCTSVQTRRADIKTPCTD